MHKAAEERDLPKRAAILFQAETVLMRDAPVIPVLFYAERNLISSRLKGWVPNARGAHATRFLSLDPPEGAPR